MGRLTAGWLHLFKYPGLDLRISTKVHCWSAPEQEIINRELSRKIVGALRVSLREMAREASDAQVNTWRLFCIRDLTMLVLRFVDETNSCLLDWRSSQHKAVYVSRRGWNAKEARHWKEVAENHYGVDLDSMEDPASDIIGKTPREICEDIVPDYRVITAKLS